MSEYQVNPDGVDYLGDGGPTGPTSEGPVEPATDQSEENVKYSSPEVSSDAARQEDQPVHRDEPTENGGRKFVSKLD